MDPISLALTAASIGFQLFGASENNKAAKKQAKLATKAAKEQNAFVGQQNAIIDQIQALLGKQKGFLTEASDASQKAETLRESQMTLDAMRTRRDIVRNMSVARAYALVTAGGQGVDLQSSGVFGALSQISAEGKGQIHAVNQNEQIGHGIFQTNRDFTEAMTNANLIGTDINILNSKIQQIGNQAQAAKNTAQAKIGAAGYSNSGSFFSAIGAGIGNNMDAFVRVGNYASGKIFGANPSSGGFAQSPIGSSLVGVGSPYMDNAGNIYSVG